MKIHSLHRTYGRAWLAALCVLLCSGLGESRTQARPGQQVSKPTPVAAPDATGVAARLAGSWAFNKDQSTITRAASDATGDTTGRPSGPPPGRGSGGGGLGGFGPGFGGGGLGGMQGGRGGEGMREGTTDEQRATKALTDELRDAPQRLTIGAGAGTVTITPDDGDARTFSTRGTKEKVDLLLAKVDVTSRWDAGALAQVFDAGKTLQLAVTYTPSADGKQLTVKLVATRPKNQGGEGKPVTRVYDRAQ